MGRASGRLRNSLHAFLGARDANVQMHGLATRIDRIEGDLGALHLAEYVGLGPLNELELGVHAG